MRSRPVLTPSFRNRLRLFFFVIVVVPMVAVALVLFRLVSTSQDAEIDAKLSQAQRSASGLYSNNTKLASTAAQTIGSDGQLAAAIRDRDSDKIDKRLTKLAHDAGASRVVLTLNGQGRFDVGTDPAVAFSSTGLVDEAGKPKGRLTVSVRTADEFANELSRLNGQQVVMSIGGRVVASTLPDAPPAPLPDRGDVDIGGTEYRVAALVPKSKALGGEKIEVRQLISDEKDRGLLSSTSLLVIGAMIGFLVLAIAFAFTVSRTLHDEIQRLLVAAKQLGRGDFSVAVPAEGNDEFAALGKEFNSMARQLEARLEELQRERARLQEAIRRVGESFAKGLDRVGLLEIVVQTAVDGIGAAAGRATMRRSAEDRLNEVARAGEPESFARALHAAEAAVIDAGQLAEIQLGGASALAAPLGATEEGDRVIGMVSVARGDRPFTAGERELFAYLTNQASVSVENVDLHETVQRQAVTDELTGLFNHRRFQEVMTAEVERARRYGHELGLIMLDIDNFKQVNDTHGHLQGDMVLREVAQVLRQSSREIDEPARYGGEEMAVALPQTDLEGAVQFAERVRRRIEALELPLLDSDGVLRVTASFGAASLAAAGGVDKDALVAAADGALYQAKRAGKNRTERATGRRSRSRQVHGVAGGE
jgi:diguanylate cyclase (GGDEF)-like protein